MRDLAETNCEIRNLINLELPAWNTATQDEAGLFDGSKESTSASQPAGGFLNSDCSYAWLSRGPRLIVLDVRAGRCMSIWTFPEKITSVSPFPTQLGCVPLLLVGLDNNAIRIKDSLGYLCIFDCCTSNVLTTIQVPAGVEKACVIHGGADWERFNAKRPDTVLSENSGLIFAALRNLQHIIIDVNRDLWEKSCYQGKSITATLEFVNVTPISAMQNTKMNKIELTHLAYDLMDKEIEQYIGFDRQDFEATPLYDESLCSVLLNSTKTGCLITGCLGRVIIWQHDGSIGWISPTFDENAYVTHVALLEPSDDPKPFYYLWICCQSDAPDSSAVLRMYMLMFKDKLTDKSGDGSSLYFNLESEPSLKFELELEQGERVHSLLAIERGNLRDTSDMSSRRGEESLLLIGTEERVLLFDLNRWYKEQMPCTIAGCRNPNSVMASYRTRQDDTPRKSIVACCYVPRSLREFPKGPHSPEELFFPNSLNLEWAELTEDSLIFWLTRGVQSELLREITIAGPIVLVMPQETYRRCLNAGLVPFDSTPQDYSFNVEPMAAREMLLSLCLEQRWANLLLRCATEWSDGSAAYLYAEFLRWGVQRASAIKLMTDRLCVPLFDQSGSNIGESEVRTLRYCVQQLECLATVVSKLPNPESDLAKHRRALKRIAAYLQVLLWFYDVGLLPETQEETEEEDDDDDVQMSLSAKIPYPRNKLIDSYKRKRRNDCDEENKEDHILFIDQLLVRECLPLKEQWTRESENTCPNQSGLYPPPSLQSLLRSFLTDCHREEQDEEDEEDEDCELPETTSKHCIVIYLLMDLAMLLEGTNAAVDHLIKYPSAFKLSPSLIKLTQAFWLLDHEDYDRFFKIMTSQLVSNSDIKDWQHKLAIDALLKNDQHKLALIYLRVIKPPLSSLNDQSMMIDLAVEQGHIESAFHARPPSHYGKLLTGFFHACKNNGKLKEILHLSLDPEEEEAFVRYLKESGCEETRLIYYLQRGRHTEASDVFSMNTDLHPRKPLTEQQMKIQPAALSLLKAFNKTLPDITKSFANSFSKNSGIGPTSGRPFVPFSMMNCKEPRGSLTKPLFPNRNQSTASEIYQLAMQKARETCLRPDRGGPGTSTYIPFLAAPYTTINFGPKFAGQSNNEQADVNCVTYPERKIIAASKRTLRMISGAEDNNVESNEIEKKRRKLQNNSDVDLSGSDNVDSCRFRRLSMSQVCNTPLVRRKEAGEPNGLRTETPHSILKIRQMLNRNSRSPSYQFGQGDVSDGEDTLRRQMAGDTRPLRQIRFSVDRLSANDESGLSANETQNEADSCTDGDYFNPNLTGKSLRDVTILSDSSMTRNFGGPRPRPGLRRRSDSPNSRGSSEEPSHKSDSSGDSTINHSEQDVSIDSQKSPRATISARRRSRRSPSIYCASILSPNTSVENSPFKGPVTVCRKEKNDDEESEEQSDDDTNIVSKFNETEFDKESSFEHTQNRGGEEEENQEDYEMEVDQEEEHERPPSENVLLDDSNTGAERQQLFNKPEDDSEDSESFQSFTNSFDEAAEALAKVAHPEDDVTQDQQDQSARDGFLQNQSLTENLIPFQRDESGNYSLTKPIFMNSQGIVGFADKEWNITDDESQDADESVRQPQVVLTPVAEDERKTREKGDEDDFVLSFSNSDGSDEEKNKKKNKNVSLKDKKKDSQLQKIGEEKENIVVKATRSFVSEELDSPPSKIALSRKNQMTSESKKDEGLRSRQSSLSSTRSDDVEDVIGAQKRSSLEDIRKVSPRRSIKSVSASPLAKVNETEKTTVRRERSSTSVTREVKKILAQVMKSPDIPKIGFENVATPPKDSEEEDEPNKDPNKLALPSNPLLEPAEDDDNDDDDVEEQPPVEMTSKSSGNKSSRGSRKERKSSESSDLTSEKSSRKRAARAGSPAKPKAEKPARKTRTASSAKESVGEAIEEQTEKTSPKSRSTKVSSTSKDTSVVTGKRTRTTSIAKDDKPAAATRKTRAGSVAIDEDLPSAHTRSRRAESMAKDEDLPSAHTRSRRAESVAKDEEQSATVVARRTRAESVLKDDDNSVTANRTRAGSVAKEVEKPVGRKKRASSLAKETNDDEQNVARRATRAGSTAKDDVPEEHDEEVDKKAPVRKRGNSVPKEVPNLLEVTKSHRGRRSTSLLKEVILEESLTTLAESPASTKRTRASRLTEPAPSSPAANTRSRRSSIQSVPEDLEEPAKEEPLTTTTTSRNRRAASVDSAVIVPAGKRLTRSVLAKATIIGEVIPEESTPVTKKQPSGRRKRATSVNGDEVQEDKEKMKAPNKPKRGRKASESKDFQFSLPVEAGDVLPARSENVCRTPTFEFSEPSGLQKFITPIRYGPESSDETTIVQQQHKTDSENKNLARFQRRPRTCFVMSKKTKDKAK